MIITIIWEDQRNVEADGFGPHELLLACVADRLGYKHGQLSKRVYARPAKGNSNVLKRLKTDGARLEKAGPVFAVVDRDKIADLWRSPGAKPLACMSELAKRFRQDAAGRYELVFLIDNVESLIEASLGNFPEGGMLKKPKPAERDRILGKIAFGDRSQRELLLQRVPSFARLVERVGNRVLDI